MQPKHNRHRKSSEESTDAIEGIMDTLFTQAKAQYGSAVKSFWFYDGDFCPACLQHPIDTIKFKGQDALAINAFIYRERGVLIGYFLCGTCATCIFKEAEKHPYRQTPLHTDIEHNLTAAYHKHLMSLDA